MRQRDVDRLVAGIRQTRENLAALEEQLPELLRRGALSSRPDGFPTSSRGGDGRRGKAELTSVERAADGRLARTDEDQVGRWLRELVAKVDGAVGMAASATRMVALVGDPTSPVVRKSTLTICCNCGEPALPRAVSGRCLACYEYRRTHDGEDRRVVSAVETWTGAPIARSS